MSTSRSGGLTPGRVFELWWPLAGSWLLMGLELPVLSAVTARLAEPEINLAAFGGVVFPVALLIESPIIQLLAASTALSRDWASYVRLRRFTHVTSCGLTLLHILVAFTPVYDIVVEQLLGAPVETHQPGRIGLQIMTPWTWTIAYRRFNQGVLIRHGHSRAVGVGTAVRMLSNYLVLLIGFVAEAPGIVVAASAMTTGVVSEAAYTAFRVRRVLDRQLRPRAPIDPPLTFATFWPFYLPLALTSFLHLLVEPIGAAALSRMPRPLDCLAAWPVLYGLVFMAQSLGIAFNEVVVALVGEPGGASALRRFASWLAALAAMPLLLTAVVPGVSGFWFGTVTGLESGLVALAQAGLWFALPLPALTVVHSFYQGVLVHSGRTRAIPESLGLFLVVASVVCFSGVRWGGVPGLPVVLVALACGAVVQLIWLSRRSRQARADLH